MDKAYEMSDFLDEARGILNKIESYQATHEKQLQMYKEMMDNSISLNKERIDYIEKRWNNVRNIMIAISGIFLLSFVSDKLALRERPTADEIEETYVKTDRAMGAFGVTVDDYYGIHEDTGEFTRTDAKSKADDVKEDIYKELDPNYRTRSIQEDGN